MPNAQNDTIRSLMKILQDDDAWMHRGRDSVLKIWNRMWWGWRTTSM